MRLKKLSAVIFLILAFLNVKAFAATSVTAAWIATNLSDGALFFDTTGETYTWETDYTFNGTGIFVKASNITIDFNGHTIHFGGNDNDGTCGVNLFRSRSDWYIGADDVNYSETASDGTCENATIKNGKIIWDGSAGTWSIPICSRRGPESTGPTIDNMQLETGGDDGMCIYLYWSPFTVSNTYCVNSSSDTLNRHWGPASFKSSACVNADHCIIVGGNSAIAMDSAADGCTVHDNILRHNSFATNGYGLWLYRNANVTAYNNLIVPSNGRGILNNAGTDHEFYDNLIVAHDEPNAEYGTRLNATCLRIRYDASGVHYHDNDCLCIGGTDVTGASGAYLTTQAGYSNTIEDNTFYAILNGDTDEYKYANGITFEGQGDEESGNAEDVIENNTFASNNYLYRLAGYDGGCYQDPIKYNDLAWISGDTAYSWFVGKIDSSQYDFSYPAGNDYVTSSLLSTIKDSVKSEVSSFVSGVPDDQGRNTFYTAFYTYDSNIEIVNGTLGTGVTMTSDDVFMEIPNGNDIDITISNSLYAECKAGGQSLPNETITVYDNTGQTQQTTTNGNAIALLEPVIRTLTKAEGAGSITQTDRSGHYAEIATYNPLNLPTNISGNEDNPYLLDFAISTDVSLSCTTDEDATCKYDDICEEFEDMDGGEYGDGAFDITGGTSHLETITLPCSADYTFYYRCQDDDENVSDCTEVNFTVLSRGRSMATSQGIVSFGAF